MRKGERDRDRESTQGQQQREKKIQSNFLIFIPIIKEIFIFLVLIILSRMNESKEIMWNWYKSSSNPMIKTDMRRMSLVNISKWIDQFIPNHFVIFSLNGISIWWRLSMTLLLHRSSGAGLFMTIKPHYLIAILAWPFKCHTKYSYPSTFCKHMHTCTNTPAHTHTHKTPSRQFHLIDFPGA